MANPDSEQRASVHAAPRRRRINTDPMRKVVKAGRRSGQQGLGHSRFAVRWWELQLECGHIVERAARSVRGASRGKRGFMLMHHPVPDSPENFQPAPARVRCDVCGRETRS